MKGLKQRLLEACGALARFMSTSIVTNLVASIRYRK